MAAGRFITFEGGEGTGKSTQVRRLAARLAAAGREVVVTREPGGTPLGEAIRTLILSSRPAVEAEFLLFAAARAEHVDKLIRPALAAGRWVVCDRYSDSTRVYQGVLAGVDRTLIDVVEAATSRAAVPDLTVVLDLPVATGLGRATRRGDLNRYDAESVGYHERIRQGFLDIARADSGRCVVVDGGASEDTVAEAIWSALGARLGVGAS